jgi:hypothetical protein
MATFLFGGGEGVLAQAPITDMLLLSAVTFFCLLALARLG